MEKREKDPTTWKNREMSELSLLYEVSQALGRSLDIREVVGPVLNALADKISSNRRIFGQGTKVAVEMALMAADAGLIQTDKDIISIGGSGKGADTAIIIRPNNTGRFFDVQVRGILCKPWDLDKEG